MIITIWAIILGLALILIFAGRFTDAPPVAIAGYSIIFILGLVLMLGSLQYQTGETSLSNYTYTAGNLTSINETIIYTYGYYDNEIVQGITLSHTTGFLICVLSVLGFISVMFNLNPNRKKPGQYDLKEND